MSEKQAKYQIKAPKTQIAVNVNLKENLIIIKCSSSAISKKLYDDFIIPAFESLHHEAEKINAN